MIQITNHKVHWKDNKVYFADVLISDQKIVKFYINIAFLDKLSTI